MELPNSSCAWQQRHSRQHKLLHLARVQARNGHQSAPLRLGICSLIASCASQKLLFSQKLRNLFLYNIFDLALLHLAGVVGEAHDGPVHGRHVVRARRFALQRSEQRGAQVLGLRQQQGTP